MADSLAAALAEFQRKLPRITKDETAQVRSEKGSYSYSYADLADVSETVLPLLGEHGLSFSARPTINESGTFVLAYELLHTSNEKRTGEYPLPANGSAQQLGSAITYARRYCLCAVVGVHPDDEDDDGATAQPQQTSQNEKPRQPRPNLDATGTVKKQVWEAAQRLGMSNIEELSQDYATRYDGLILGDATADELRVYLGVLQELVEIEDTGNEKEPEPGDAA